ncbi:hypothetical protein DFH11DRAFT_1690673 [Phellopilus nigrolimitatus]|nr:hypothetical protein DFH11DRAFT_1690673 [Phellopilus nigrolimitatus]
MAILSFFKKDKPKASSSKASTSTVALNDAEAAEDYILSPPSASTPSVGNGDDGYASSNTSFASARSSKKLRLPFSKKKSATSALDVVDKLSLNPSTSLNSFPSRSAVFPSFHASSSSPALSRPNAADARAQAPKSGAGLFGWRERRKSKPSMPENLVLPPSFRHGRSPPQSSPVSLVSPAHSSQPQARRSSTNLVSGSPSPTIPLPRPPPHAVRSSVSTSPSHARNVKITPSRPSTRASLYSNVRISPSRSRSRLSRQRTITKRSYRANSDLGHGTVRTTDYSHHQQSTSTRSELSHGSPARTAHSSPSRGPPPSSFQNASNASVGTRSISIYRRQRASYSTSELNPNAAAKRASTLVEANKRDSATTQRQSSGTGSDTSDSDSESESSDENAPLSVLMQPKRPKSDASYTSSSTPIRKPLVDLNSRTNPLTGKPVVDTSGVEREKMRSTLISPTNINDRLSQLASAAGLRDHRITSASKSDVNLSSLSSPRLSQVQDHSKSVSPVSSGVASRLTHTTSPEAVEPKTRRSSVSSPVSSPVQISQESDRPQSDALRPVPIRGRTESNSGFTVVSRPQRSATTSPPAVLSSVDIFSKHSKPQQQSAPATHNRQAPSTSSAGSTRPQSSMPALNTKPLIAPSQTAKPGFPSPVSVSPSSRVTSTTQPPPHRQDSPASSTGGSSNGKAPLTPMDGSDYFTPDVRAGVPPSAMKGGRGHLKRASVSFQDMVDFDKDETVRGRKSSMVPLKREEDMTAEERENRRRERRRSEAKAAIELGNVIHGRGPTEAEDDEDGSPIPAGFPPRLNAMNTGGVPSGGMNFNFSNTQMSWQQQGMPPHMMGGMPGMGGMGHLGGTPGMNMNGQQFMVPTPPAGADPAFLVAHQQAMLIAKQAYQYAVAQQAMAAAGDEWERGSSVSGFAPAGRMGIGGGGYGMGGGMNGMGGMWGGGGPMFPAGPHSMYGGSNVGATTSEAGWGAASVYGESFGPSMSASPRRSQAFGGGHVRNSSGGGNGGVGFPGTYQRSDIGHVQQAAASPSRNAPRQKTKSVPSNAPLPAQHRHSRGPPSSWKIGT